MLLATTTSGPLIDRGIGRVAKPQVIELHPAGKLHLAAAGQYNRGEAAWQSLEVLLAEIPVEDGRLASALEERALPLQWTPLQYAARHGSLDDLHRLLDAGADS